jgi:hypothetical protein
MAPVINLRPLVSKSNTFDQHNNSEYSPHRDDGHNDINPTDDLPGIAIITAPTPTPI